MTTVHACPQCGAEVQIKQSVRLYEIIECPSCSSELEVMSLSPVMLALAPEVEEDWGE